MPYVNDPNEDEENQSSQSQSSSSNPTSINISGASPSADPGAGSPSAQASGSSPSQSSNAGGTGGSANPKALDTGSGFQNLDKYLTNNSAQAFGGQVLGKVQDTVNQAKQDQSDASNEFENTVSSANTVPTSDQVSSAIANPASADATQFQGWLNQNYGGPNSLAEDQSAASKFNSGTSQATTQAGLLNNESGRFSLLDSYFGNPSYNYGQKSLDNLLVQNSGLGAEQKNIQNQATALQGQGAQQQQQLQDFASAQKASVDNSRESTRAAIGIDDNGQITGWDPTTNTVNTSTAGALGNAYNQALQAEAATNSANTTQEQAIQQALQSGTITGAQAKNLGGLTSGSTYNLNLANYVTPGAAEDLNQTMTPDQRAYIQALSSLAGVTDNFANGATEEAGNPYGFNTAQYTQDLASAKTAYTNSYANAIKTIQNTAPLTGSYLSGLNTSTDPNSILNQLNSETAFWQQQQQSGNPTAPTRLNQLAQSTAALNNVLKTYDPYNTLTVNGGIQNTPKIALPG